MASLLWQKTIFPEAILTSGMSASGAVPAFSTQGRPVIKVPLDDAGDVWVVLRCGRIIEPYAGTASLLVHLSFFTGYTNGPYEFRTRCSAKAPPDDGDALAWNAVEASVSGSFPATSDELVHAEITVPTGDARDNLVQGDEFDILLRLLPDGARPAGFLYLREVEVRQELPGA